MRGESGRRAFKLFLHDARSIDDATDPGREHVQGRPHACEQEHRRDCELNDFGQAGDAMEGK